MRTVLSPSWRSTSRVPSLLPSSTTMISRSMPSGSSTARMRRSTSTTVLRSLYTGTITDSLRSFARRHVTRGHGPAPPGTRRACARDPRAARSSAPNRGARAPRAMSGRRRVGSSVGSGSNTSSDLDARDLAHELGQLQHRELDRVADVDRVDDVGVEEREDPAHLVVDEAERARLLAGAVDRERFARRSPARGSSTRRGRRPAAGAGRTC